LQAYNAFNINEHISVLFVEDDLSIQKEFVDILSFIVDEVYVASNGKEGLELFDKYLPNIIITDIQMPIMSGIEMCKKIREKDHDTPIIITSAFNDTHYLLDAIGLGIEYYLLKPIMIDQLQDRLTHVKKRLMQKRELEVYQLYLEDRLEEEVALREAKEALLIEQNKSSEIGQMVSIIAHQWKQPLHYLNLLIEDIKMEDEYQGLSKEYINDFVKKGTDRITFLSDTMNNFLRFYKSNPDANTFLISNVIKEVFLFLDMLFTSLGIKIDIEIDKDFSLHGIENEFQQVILNLMNNAKDAFSAQKKIDAYIKISISKENNQGIVKIEDNAGGIKPSNIARVFELDFTTKPSGNGIGLYLVKQIIEQRFNGSIKVTNNEEGACFTLYFNINKGGQDA